MHRSIRHGSNSLIAIISGAAVTAGLVLVPPPSGRAAVVEDAVVAAVQLHSLATTLRAAVVISDGTPMPSTITDTAPPDVLQSVASAEESGDTVPPAEAPSLQDALISTALSVVTMIVLAPISIALSPLLLIEPGFRNASGCGFAGICYLINWSIADLIIAVTVGPVKSFISNLQNLWSALFPPTLPASQTATAPLAASLADGFDPTFFPEPDVAAGTAQALAAAPGALGDGDADGSRRDTHKTGWADTTPLSANTSPSMPEQNESSTATGPAERSAGSRSAKRNALQSLASSKTSASSERQGIKARPGIPAVQSE